MATPNLVVLGGGVGGIVAAHELHRRMGATHRVVLIERNHVHRFAPSLLWVMSGARRAERISADLRHLRRRGVEFSEATVEGIDPGRQRVMTSTGAIAYERLVVALGADLAPQTLPGFSETAHNLYSLEGSQAAHDALSTLRTGRVAILVSRLPYKCPAAPYEAAFLADALLRRRGSRSQIAIDVYTPEPAPMPTAGPRVGDAVSAMLLARGIGYHPGLQVERIDPHSRRLLFAGGAQADVDVLIGVPPHRAPAALADSGLAGPTGFVAVDRATMQTAVEGIHAVGDATQIPLADGRFMLPKAGVFAHAQARVAAARIAAELRGRDCTTTFDGHGACFLELGDGSAGYASGDFFAPGAPEVRMRRPGRHWHLAKVAFERYWLRRWF